MPTDIGPVLETIENALRADQTKLIEAERVGEPAGIRFDVPWPPEQASNAIRGHDPISSASPLAQTNELTRVSPHFGRDCGFFAISPFDEGQ